MPAKKKKAKFTVLIFIFLAIIAFFAGYALQASGISKEGLHYLRAFFGGEQETAAPDQGKEPPGGQTPPPGDPGNGNQPPGGNPELPDEEPPGDPGNGNQPPGGNPELPDEEPPGSPDDQPADPVEKPDQPVIYPGEALVIPGLTSGDAVPAGPSRVVSSGTLPSQGRRIALTFDSGWLYDQTIPLLNLLDQYGIKATFFPRAYWVKDHPDLAKEIVRRGHVMGNHSLTHPQMRELTAEQVTFEMRESTRIIEEVTGVRPYLFRPPYGAYNQLVLELLGREGYPYTVMWTVDTHDWADTIGGQKVTVDYIVDRVLSSASDNGIVLMHIGGPKTVAALPEIIEGLRRMGYSFSTVDQMLPRPDVAAPATYTVKEGDTLFSIAQMFGVAVEQLIEANELQ